MYELNEQFLYHFSHDNHFSSTPIMDKGKHICPSKKFDMNIKIILISSRRFEGINRL